MRRSTPNRATRVEPQVHRRQHPALLARGGHCGGWPRARGWAPRGPDPSAPAWPQWRRRPPASRVRRARARRGGAAQSRHTHPPRRPPRGTPSAPAGRPSPPRRSPGAGGARRHRRPGGRRVSRVGGLPVVGRGDLHAADEPPLASHEPPSVRQTSSGGYPHGHPIRQRYPHSRGGAKPLGCRPSVPQHRDHAPINLTTNTRKRSSRRLEVRRQSTLGLRAARRPSTRWSVRRMTLRRTPLFQHPPQH